MNRFIKSRHILIISSIFWNVCSANSQAFTNSNFSAPGQTINYAIAPFAENIDGSSYYNPEWQKGMIYFDDSATYNVDQLKYDVYHDELVFNKNGTAYLVPKKSHINRAVIGSEEFLVASHGKDKHSFFKVVERGDQISLVEKIDCTILKGEPSKGYIPATNDKFVLKDGNYYIRTTSDKKAFAINPKHGTDVLAYMTDKQGEVQSFITSNKLKMKNIDDLRKVIRYFNEL